MDALQHADELLSNAHRRHPKIVVPASATSPMDDRKTLVIPQFLIDQCEPDSNESSPSYPAADNKLFGILDDVALAVLDRDAALAKADQIIVDEEMAKLACGRGSRTIKQAI